MDQNNGFNDQNNNDYTNQNNTDYTNQYNQYNQPQQPQSQPQPQQYQQYDYTQPQQYNEPYFNQQYPTYHEVNNGRKGMGIASMVLGIVSFLIMCCVWYVAPIVSIVGLVLGIISLKKEDAGKGMAITGIILSSIALLVSAIIIVCVIVAFSNTELYESFYDEFYNDFYF